jgi:thiosulfate/3-mercaptopyruvate sulfurtransferase
MFTSLLSATLLLAGGGDAPKQTYPRGDLLIEAAELAARAMDFRILDARPKAAYDQGHIPGAVWVDHDAWSKAFAQGQDPATWSGRIGKLGVEANSRVVLYDDSMGREAARVWWILRYFGLKDARLLNGGWRAWKTADLPVSTETPKPLARDFVIETPDSRRLVTKQQVLDLLKDAKAQIIDARSEGEFCGDTSFAKRAGSIPGAKHLEWSDALDPKTHRFRSAAELTRRFKEAGIDPAKPAVTYCQSGGRAAVMAFTLELMGAKDVANYYRSWSEWGNAEDTPVVQPKKK